MTTTAFSSMPRRRVRLLLRQLAVLILVLSFPIMGPCVVYGTERQARVWTKRLQARAAKQAGDTWYGTCPLLWKKNKRRWIKNAKKWDNPKCYSYVMYRSCECMEDMSGPNRVHVQDGKITKVTFLGGGGENEKPSVYPVSYFHTMNGLFKDAYTKCFAGCPKAGAAKCAIQYDATRGYITNTFIDETVQVADEETSYRISEFQEC